MELPAIEQLNLHASPSEIEEWVERFELWCSVRRGGAQNQAALFLTAGGRDMYSLLKNLAFPEAPAKLPFETLKELLLNHVVPADFQATERAKFNTLVRAENMPCRDFILQLNKQAAKCNYGDRLDEQLCDRLVAGINNITLQRKLLEQKDLTFAEARKICEQHDDLVQATGHESLTLFQRRDRKTTNSNVHQREQQPKPHCSSTKKPVNRCMSCGDYHLRSTCRFRNAKCHACGKTGHIRKVCRQSRCNLAQPSAATDDCSPVYTLRTMSDYEHYIYKNVIFQSGAQHKFIVDTGSGESIISKSVLQFVCPNAVIRPTTVKILGVTGHRLPLLGEASLMVQNSVQQFVPIRFLIAQSHSSILGLKALRILNQPVLLNAEPTIRHKKSQMQSMTNQRSKHSGGKKVTTDRSKTAGDTVFKRHPIPYVAAENLVETVKSAIASANPKTLGELEVLLDDFLLQYQNSVHTTTRERPARPFMSRSLRSSLNCMDSSEAIHFRELSAPEQNTNEEEPEDSVLSSQPQHTEDDVNPAEKPTTARSDDAPIALRRPVRRANQFDEALLREESCGEPAIRWDSIQGTTRHSFRTLRTCRNPTIDDDDRRGVARSKFNTTNRKPRAYSQWSNLCHRGSNKLNQDTECYWVLQ